MDSLLDKSLTKKVRQANVFVESPYAQEFTAHEIKLFEVAISECRAEDIELFNKKNDKEFSFTAKKLAELLNTSVSVISQSADRLSSNIMKKYISQKYIDSEGNVEFEKIGIMPFARYKKGVFEFHLNYRLLLFFVEINKNFTEFQLHNLLYMDSAYAIKLYKLLYQYKNIGKRVFTIDELKAQFGITNSYLQYKHFKSRIINFSVEEINYKTDLTVEYKEIKYGRKVSELEFLFKVKSNEKPMIDSNDKNINIDTQKDIDLSNILPNLKHDLSESTKKMVSKFYEEKGIDYIQSSIEYAQKNAKTNFDKYLQDTLTNNWAEAMIKKNIARRAAESKKIAVENQQKTKKQLEQEQDQLNKSQIEHEWHKLSDLEQKQYSDFTNLILKKHADILVKFPKWEDVLQYCIYAVSTNRTYDSIIEGYFQKKLNKSLTIDKD